MTDRKAAAVEIDSLLQKAREFAEANKLADAAAILRAVLAGAPTHVNALRLAAAVASSVGEKRAMEDFLRRWSEADPANPDAHRQYGHAAGHARHFKEAVAAYGRAVKLSPGSADLRADLAVALISSGDDAAAEPELRHALELDPKNARALARLRNLLLRNERLEEALAAHDRATGQSGVSAENWKQRGNILQPLGRLAEAEEAYRRAVALEPANHVLQEELARLIWRRGAKNYLADIDAAIARTPDHGTLEFVKGNILTQAGRMDEAVEAYARGLRVSPDSIALNDGYARALSEVGRTAEAIPAHERALARAPDDVFGHGNFAQTLLRAGDPARALIEAETAERLAPDNQFHIALKGLAWRALGDPREAWLNDYERLVKVYDLPVPDGFADMAAFNAELDRYLDAMHVDEHHPLNQSLRNGTQTLANILNDRTKFVVALRTRIEDAVRDYIAQLPDDATHPVSRRKRDGFAFNGSWSSRLRSSGYHVNHVHPMGWISSAYYVALPDTIGSSGGDRAGWLKFGETDFDVGIKDMARKYVKPAVGRLVLFPSYVWHGTVPFLSVQNRTTIAFDAVPAG